MLKKLFPYINDEGIEILVNALTKTKNLQELDFGSNPLITIKGWKAVATLLEAPDCSLEKLFIYFNTIGDDGAHVFANAFVNNSTLKKLDLDYCHVTREGWTHFSKLLCDSDTVSVIIRICRITHLDPWVACLVK